ncbi:MAG: thiol:disulfide interchange protein DsbA/DsbL [gamma proteobacterium symbiont of Bathyaustriella thionipta]|nr:thiol:disulfide interchange protein DsbA/DsbL [gamma proteobacterium symbiont of Bathyaustriella thionipta]
MAVTSWALAAQPVTYKTLNKPVPVDQPDKIEVLEFFWYGCPHCYHFEPEVSAWLETKADDVVFKRVAAPLNPAWGIHSKFYYTAEAMGVVDKLHKPLFDALNSGSKEQRAELYSKDGLIQFAANHGVDADKFRTTWDSFFVNLRINQAKKLAALYKVTGVPAVAVNGKYKSGLGLAGSYPNVINTINQLIDKERAGKTAITASSE